MQESPSSKSSSTQKFLNQIKLDVSIKKNQKQESKELHKKRVQCLREELEFLKATEWMYKPVNQC